MHRITPGTPYPVFNVAATRHIEQTLAATLPPHTLMQRAGLAVARLAMALAPHARTVWIACGPGNNGGDGLEAAALLQQWGRRCVVTWLGSSERAPADARASWHRAQEAGVVFADTAPQGLGPQDLCIDALLGIGLASGKPRNADTSLLTLLQALHDAPAPVLAVDIPSGLQADTGTYAPELIADSAYGTGAGSLFHAQNTLTLLTLKPGLFTASGRDAAGTVWFDDLGADPSNDAASAWLAGAPASAPRQHASHKGSYGDVAVIGGAPGMAGAALLAASAALHSGAGRVFTCLLDGNSTGFASAQPELMLRAPESLDLATMAVVCGCGGGTAVRALLPRVLTTAASLVLDADALNAIATDPSLQTLLRQRAQRGAATVLTPHPLEAARLLDTTTPAIQADRLRAAQQLADAYQCTVVLKGSGSIVATPGSVPSINPTGNAKLATAGTGDVLAGMVGAALAAGRPAPDAALTAVWHHGTLADQWPTKKPLTASKLAQSGY